MALPANTFTTFLETFRQLDSSRGTGGGDGPDKDVLTIALFLRNNNGSASVGTARDGVDLSQEGFLRALLAGRDKGLFEIVEGPDEAVVNLTKLGMSIVR
jgi:hypothetical protein